MKIKPEHYELLKQLIQERVTKGEVEAHKERLKGDSRVKDINKRLRWDVYYFATKGKNEQTGKEFYKYLNNCHVDTALKNIFKELYGTVEYSV